jgi:hypothetical protein
MYRWRTDEIGMVWVNRDGGPEFVPTLRGENAKSLDRVIDRWTLLAEDVATRWSLPSSWLVAMIWRESNGNPRSIRHEPNGWTGIGLLQITHPALKGPLSDEQLYDPETNLEIGARYIARSIVPKYGRDFPRVSAAFNAGSVRHSDTNEWQMVCTGNHVDAEVGALNYQILRARETAEKAFEAQFDLVDLLDLGPHAHDTEPVPTIDEQS